MKTGAYRELAIVDPGAVCAALRAAAEASEGEARRTLVELGEVIAGLALGRVVVMLDPAQLAPQSVSQVHSAERAVLLAALTAAAWDRTAAAKALGIPRRTFYRRMAEYGFLDGAKPRGLKAQRLRALANGGSAAGGDPLTRTASMHGGR